MALVGNKSNRKQGVEEQQILLNRKVSKSGHNDKTYTRVGEAYGISWKRSCHFQLLAAGSRQLPSIPLLPPLQVDG